MFDPTSPRGEAGGRLPEAEPQQATRGRSLLHFVRVSALGNRAGSP